MKVFSIGLLGLAVLVLVFAIGMRYVSTPTMIAPGAPDMATTTIEAESDSYKITLAYPKFGIPKADQKVQGIIDLAVSEFKDMPENPTPVAAKNELISQFTPIERGADIQSALLEIYEYAGGAHGGTTAFGLNFHRDGTEVTLDEALALTGKSLQQISDVAKAQLQKQFDIVQFPDGAAPKPENYSTFVVGSDSVTFIFQQYQVEAYAAGMPQIKISRIK